MNQINLLRQALKPHLEWHGARLSFLALFLVALLRVKTVNLAEIATGFRTNALTESNYKRLQRFFRDFDLDYAVVARLIVASMNIPQPWVLSTDRTIAYGNPPAKLSNRRSRLVFRANSFQYSHVRSSA